MARFRLAQPGQPIGRLGRAVDAVKRFFGIGRAKVPLANARQAAPRGKAGAGGGGTR